MKQDDDISDIEGLTAAREAAGDDRSLLAFRELELAWADIPSTIGGARCGRLITTDALALTVEATDTHSGQPLLLRILRSRWSRDPVLRRRFSRPLAHFGQPALLLPTLFETEERPFLRLQRPGPSAEDLLALEAPLDPGLLASLLGDGALALSALEAAGLSVAPPLASLIFLRRSSAGRHFCLAWLDPFDPSISPRQGISALGRLASRFDPAGSHPLGLLAASFAEEPPPSARDAPHLLRKALHSSLLDVRHHVSRAGRRTTHREGRARLGLAIEALSHALPPPAGRVCLRAGRDGVLMLVLSDGRHIWGGPSNTLDTSALPLVYSAEGGLDPAGSRQVLRGWATRGGGDELQRDFHQRSLGGTEALAHGITRWLAAMARLRSSALLSALELHPKPVRHA